MTAKNCPFPCILQHQSSEFVNWMNSKHSSDENSPANYASVLDFYTKEPIWKIENYDKKTMLCYSSLNDSVPSSEFEYYFDYADSRYRIATIAVEFDKMQIVNAGEELSYGNSVSIGLASFDDYLRCIVSYVAPDKENSKEKGDLDSSIDKLAAALQEYPKCIIENNKRKVLFTPFNVKKVPSQIVWKQLASNILTNIYNSVNVKNLSLDMFAFDEEYPNNSFIGLLLDGLNDNEYVEQVRNQILFLMKHHEIDSTNYTWDSVEPSFQKIENKLTFFDLLENLPVDNCFDDTIKIVAWFKNNTGTTFIHDYALDLDLSCHVEDPENKSKHIGYWGGFSSTKYLDWSGDATAGDFETVGIKYIHYKEDYPTAKTMTVDLGLCWHDTSEIKYEDVTVSVFHANIREDIPVKVLNTSNKECQDRTLVFSIDLENSNITWEEPKNYILLTVNMKETVGGYSDWLPDVSGEYKKWTTAEWGMGLNFIDTGNFWIRVVDSETLQFLSKDPLDSAGYNAMWKAFNMIFDPSLFLRRHFF